jgi:hypothetical protein
VRDLSIRELDAKIGAGGRVFYDFVLKNHGSSVCTISGYPSAVALDADGKPATGVVFEHAARAFRGPEHQRVRTIALQPGGHAWFEIMGNDGMGNPKPCQIIDRVRIRLPGRNPPFPRIQRFATCPGFDTPSISFFVPGVPE